VLRDHHCFEKDNAPKEKSYVFHAEHENDLERWLLALRRTADLNDLESTSYEGGSERESAVGTPTPNMNGNPMHKQRTVFVSVFVSEDSVTSSMGDSGMGDTSSEGGESEQDPDRLRTLSSASTSLPPVAMEKEGWLHKKSTRRAMMKGWQKRYFFTNENGDIEYYKTVST
jgi:hypothetical protein